MRVRILVVIAFCAVGVAAAQTAWSGATNRYLSLPQCIDLALKDNLDAQIARVSADITGFNLSGAYGAYDPVLSFRATRAHVSLPGDFDPQKFNPDFPYQLTTDSAGPSLEGLLPIGMSYSFQREGRP